MTDDRSPPPEAEAWLCLPYPSSQKGGTLIAANVTSIQKHEQLLHRPDAYRPKECKRCHCPSVHIHAYRERVLAAESARVTSVVCFRCSNPECEAVWRVLPALLARCLWRSWQVVEIATMLGAGAAASSPVPKRTRRRWKQRLGAAARLLLTALASSTDAVMQQLAGSMADAASRLELVVAHAQVTGCSDGWRLASLASLIHQLAPGIRVM